VELRRQWLVDVGAALTASAGGRQDDWRADGKWIAALAATLAVILALNPVGYLGGGLDDYRYLQAARCWVASGPCLPTNHWDARWPLVAALAASISAFGESRIAVGLPNLLYAIGCLALLAMIGNRLFKPPVGYLAALLLLTVPSVAVELLDPSVGSAELFFLLASALALCVFVAERRHRHAFVAGLAWALACQVRETALIGLLPLAVVLWRSARRDPGALVAAAVGAALPFVVEALIFWLQTGDPFYRRTLSLGHTRIATTELVRAVDPARSPLFNPAYIGGWRHEPGLQWHWAVDGLVNLFVNLKAGVVLPLTALFALVALPRLSPPERRAWWRCVALFLLWAAVLIYALAIDPKPRMMLVPLTLGAVALALLLRALARDGSRPLAVVGGGTAILLGLAATATHPQIYSSAPTIARWAAQHPRAIMVDATARAHLALTPAASDFAALSSERTFLLMRSDQDCQAQRHPRSGAIYRAVDRSSLDPFGRPGFGFFCLLRRDDRGAPGN
jgi:4-amino-4-deoxy-L-arabinose transferase-like glycosyltransferase